ncbi:MAG: hypothetical protein IPJ65_25140 [Archangiaceae bacterium]|nr:hypothetical protein [Archangiaceae bacterium]
MGRYDGDYRSVAWAALGAQGLCGDGFPPDGEGAGLWPLAVHNQVVATLTKGMVPNVQNPNDAFDVGRPAACKVSLHDVLDPAELRTVTFFRTSCLIADTTMASLGKLLSVDEKDRLVSAPVMRALLKHALGTLNRDKLESVAVLEARIFDIDLAMVQMAERKARQEAGVAKQKGRRAGLSDAAAAENAGQARKWKPGSPQEALLKRSLTWSPDEWLTLSQQRRLFLFAQAKPVAESGARGRGVDSRPHRPPGGARAGRRARRLAGHARAQRAQAARHHHRR